MCASSTALTSYHIYIWLCSRNLDKVAEKRPRGERGGKKTKRQKQLWEQTVKGERTPKEWRTERPNYGSQRSAQECEVETVEVITSSVRSLSSAPSRLDPVKEFVSVEVEEDESRNLPSSAASQASVLQSLSQEITADQRLGPSRVKVTAPAISLPVTEVRASLDFHQTLDNEFAGGRCYEGIRSVNRQAIFDFLSHSPKHFLSIVSYIGERGRDSSQRREDLKRAVIQLNQKLHSLGIRKEQLVRVLITSDKAKRELVSSAVSVHVDDKESVLESCYNQGVEGIWYSRRLHRHYQCCSTIKECLDYVQRSVQPREYSSPKLGVALCEN